MNIKRYEMVEFIIMKIVIWMLVVICISLFFGECYYRYLRKKELIQKKIFDNISNSINESTEYDLDDLEIEAPITISRDKLQMRGSWRLAQDQIMTYPYFRQERDNEYKKKL